MIIDKSVKLPKVNMLGFCIGYKNVIKEDMKTDGISNGVLENMSSYRAIVDGPAYAHIYKIGKNVSNRICKKASVIEIELGVNEGFHTFLNKESAIKDARDEDKTIRVYFRPKDVVSTGVFYSKPCVVTTKLTIKSLRALK
jgi:hypothetical protein